MKQNTSADSCQPFGDALSEGPNGFSTLFSWKPAFSRNYVDVNSILDTAPTKGHRCSSFQCLNVKQIDLAWRGLGYERRRNE